MTDEEKIQMAEHQYQEDNNSPEMKAAYQAALAEWTGILAQLWTVIGKPVEQDRLRIYRDQLQKVPLGLLELAIARVMLENVYANVPQIGVIWAAIRKELHDPGDWNGDPENWEPDYKSRREQMELFE